MGYGYNSGVTYGGQLGQYQGITIDPKITCIMVSLQTCKELLEEFKKGEQSAAYLKAFFLIANKKETIDNLEYLELLEQLEEINVDS